MRWFYKLPLRLRSLFRRSRVEEELSDELRFHLEKLAEEKVAKGMTAEEARYAALHELGGVEQIKEECRDMRRVNYIENFVQDVRYGLRMLAKNPGFTAVAVITLALGIGANTAIFSLVNGVLLQPLPFAQPDRLVGITDWYPQGALVAMRANLGLMEVAGYSDGQELNLTGLGSPIRLYGAAVSSNFFSLLGVPAELGRTFLSGEDQPGNDNVVILSHPLWQQKFDGDPKAIGRSVMLEGQGRQIVGVMPAGFQIRLPGLQVRAASSQAQFWIPLHLDPRAAGAYWGGSFRPIVGRLRAGVTQEQAGAEFRAYIPKMRGMFPWKMPDALWASSDVIPLQESLVGGARTKLLLLLGATGLVLLIACANVANLLLARATTRQKEMAVRAALGAGSKRICQQLLTESVILAICGGALGALLAMKGMAWLKAILPADTPRLAAVAMDWRVMAFTTWIAILTGLIFGTIPAFHGSRINLTESLKTGRQHSTAASHRLRSSLAIAEVALAVVLVIGAGLTLKSLWELWHVNPGFRTESIVTARITPNEAWCADFARCQNFYNELVERTRALPGIEDAAVANVLPLTGRINAFAADLEDHPRAPKDPAPVIFETIITPNYLRLMGIPLLRGRELKAGDMAPEAPPVALVTASMARKFWPQRDPIGKHLKRAWMSEWSTTVVGVTGDVNEHSLAAKLPDFADGAVYVPYGNGARAGVPRPAEMTLVVRTTNNLASLAGELQRIVSSLNPDVPVGEMRTLSTVVSESAEAPRSTTWLFGIFAAIALLLGAVGVYGVISYSVAERTREIGIRLALGADKLEVMRLVMGQGARLALVGVGIGLAGALALTRLLSSLLYGVQPTDPLTFMVVASILIGVVLLASYIPARRATKVDPMVALRYE
jgi:putative ABC transport system permease protein